MQRLARIINSAHHERMAAAAVRRYSRNPTQAFNASGLSVPNIGVRSYSVHQRIALLITNRFVSADPDPHSASTGPASNQSAVRRLCVSAMAGRNRDVEKANS